MGSFKNILFKNQWVRKAEISMKEFLRSTDTSLKPKKTWSPGVRWSPQIGKVFKYLFQSTMIAILQVINLFIYISKQI